MIASGPVSTQYQPTPIHFPSPVVGSHSSMTDQQHKRSLLGPLRTSPSTVFQEHSISSPRSAFPQSSERSHFYDPILDSKEPSSRLAQQSQQQQRQQDQDQEQEQRYDSSHNERKMSGRSSESSQSAASQRRLPPISQLHFNYDSHGRSSDRHSPPSSYSARSPISLSQQSTSPYPLMGSNQPYHSVYAESPSASSSHTILSPRDQYSQVVSNGSPSQYGAPGYGQTSGHTPLGDMRTPMSTSAQTPFSPISNERSPVNDQRPFSQDGQLPQIQTVAGGYQCTHEQCIDRPPFQTQYLLTSHQNVHKPDRPYYCPVPECPRSNNGKPNSGFKRKNELIRHQLVHNSPGYACPFCPDRDHKYPRPDNLQRHVKVHHVDKSKDDPELRAILAQRTDSGGSRRRRVNSTS